jgi:SNF2 family DNA or RNA helicase
LHGGTYCFAALSDIRRNCDFFILRTCNFLHQKHHLAACSHVHDARIPVSTNLAWQTPGELVDVTMEGDPYHWSTDQVAHFFRHHAAQVARERSKHNALPDLDALAQKLMDNDINGVILLEDVDTPFLREECGIASFGHRTTITYCIRKLKLQSQTLTPGNIAPQTPSSVIATPAPDHSEPTPPIEHSEPLLVRSGEEVVQDERGRKRRKITLVPSKTDHHGAAPAPVPAAAFLRDDNISLDELFFGNAALGCEVGDMQPDGYIHVDAEALKDPELAMTNFSFHDQGKLPGESQFVWSHIRHFLGLGAGIEEYESKHVRPLKRRNREAVAILPYDGEKLAGKKSQSALVVQMPKDGKDAIVVRENAAFLEAEQELDYSGLPDQAQSGEWDYLLANHRGSDVLPTFGESDSEDVASSLGAEMAEESEEEDDNDDRPLKGSKLDLIIDKALDAMAEHWKTHQQPRLEENRAWTEWKKTKKSRIVRDALLEGTNGLLRQLEARLQKFKEMMHSEEWTSEKQVTEDCERMQATVEDIEMQRWKMEVWQRKKEPPHTVRQGGRSVPAYKTSGPQAPVVLPQDRLSVEPPDGPIVDDDDDFHSAHGSISAMKAEEPVDQDEDNMDASDEMSVEDDVSDDSFIHDSPGARSAGLLLLDRQESDSEEATSPATALKTFKAELKTPVKMSNASEPIEISSDSTTPRSGQKARHARFPKKIIYSAQPENDKASEVEIWSIPELVKNCDRKRILIKLLYDAGPEKRKALIAKMKELRRPAFVARLREALTAIHDPKGIPDSDPVIALSARLLLAYGYLKLRAMMGEHVEFDLHAATDDLTLKTFFGLLEIFLPKRQLFEKPNSTGSSPLRGDAGNALQIIDLDSDDSLSEAKTPRGRKRRLKLGAVAEQSQVAAFQRQERTKAMEKEASNSQELTALIHGDASKSEVVINASTRDVGSQEKIFIHKPIAAQVKEHQIKGIQFMWRELIADEGGQGCILAHEMGLGKTMQTIAVLVALNEAAQSNNPAVSSQLPKHLRPKDIRKRQLRMLIICPPALVQNWRNEIAKWAGEALAHVFSVESGQRETEYLEQMKSWYKVGGVLLIGYSLFRDKVARKKEGSLELDRYLTNGPEVVVADEAHMLKNDKSEVSLCAKRIRTHCRIGLTGTPMSNDVDEIYALVSFAAPDYLGEKAWFNQKYSKPIREGNSYDSTPNQIRQMMKKLAVLRQSIEPKVHRADITVLRGSIPPKTEFVITLPLTRLQEDIYNRYLDTILGDKGRARETSQVTIFAWLAILTLLTNHPWAFKKKMLEPADVARTKKKKQKTAKVASLSDDDIPLTAELAEDDERIGDIETTIHTLGLSDEAIKNLTQDIPDDDSPELSAKMMILIKILDISRQCGDKVLVFTSRLPTLDYVERLLRKRGIKYGRIDGHVQSSRRQQLIEDFDDNKKEVMIISTRAGGVGLNIQKANRVVILDFGFNPTNEQQAIGRSYRLGQQKPVFVYRLVVGGTFEDEIYNKQMFKTSLTSRVVDKKNPRRCATGQAGEWLYPPKKLIQQDLQQWIGKDAVLDTMLSRQMKTAEDSYEGPVIRSLITIETLQEEADDLPLNEEEQREVREELEASRTSRLNARRGPSNLSWSQSAMPPPSTAPIGGPRMQTHHPAMGQGMGVGQRSVVVFPYNQALSHGPAPYGGALQKPASTMPNGT